MVPRGCIENLKCIEININNKISEYEMKKITFTFKSFEKYFYVENFDNFHKYLF